jgi:hypothetical protein
MVDECCFPHEINFAPAGVLKHLTPTLSRGDGVLPELKDDWSDAQKLEIIEQVYQELSNPARPGDGDGAAEDRAGGADY